MKTKVKAFNIETANAYFNLTIFEVADGKGFVGEYFGSTPKVAQAVRPGAPTPMMREIGSGESANKDIVKLIVDCQAAIEKIDGPIQGTIEDKL